ncbi:MAG: hypothetical protein AAGJ28_24740 [Pseudomonadota bacterium]
MRFLWNCGRCAALMLAVHTGSAWADAHEGAQIDARVIDLTASVRTGSALIDSLPDTRTDTRAAMQALLDMPSRAGFVAAALYPDMNLPNDDIIETADFGFRSSGSAAAGSSVRSDGLSIIPLNRTFGLTIDESSGRPYVQGLILRANAGIELRATTVGTDQIEGGTGQIALRFSF